MDWLDSLLLPLFDLTGNPANAFYAGTFLLAMIIALLGEITVAALYLSNRRTFDRLHQELTQTHTLSIDAIKREDTIAYETYHRKANEAFAKVGGLQMALMVGSMWPLFFAAAFLNTQFSDVHYPLPLVHWQIHYILVFIVMYGLARLVLSPVKYILPNMGKMKSSMDDARAKAKELQDLLADETKD